MLRAHMRKNRWQRGTILIVLTFRDRDNGARLLIMPIPNRFLLNFAAILVGLSSVDVRADETTPVVQTRTWAEVESSLTEIPVAVVDLWSLSCAPCLKEYPGLVALQKKHRDQVRGIAVSVDYDGRRSRPPESYLDRVKAFVGSVGGEMLTNYLCETPSDDVLTAVDAASIPTVLIYQHGQLVRQFSDSGASGGFTYADDVASAVASLLNLR